VADIDLTPFFRLKTMATPSLHRLLQSYICFAGERRGAVYLWVSGDNLL
jgi:hypothetical protein